MPKRTHDPDVEALDQALQRAEDYLGQARKPEPRFVFERPEIKVREIRESLGLSRQDFAMEFGISLRTLQNWEDGRREPEGPARILLVAIKYEPAAVRRAVVQYRGASDTPASTAKDAAGFEAVNDAMLPPLQEVEVMANTIAEVARQLMAFQQRLKNASSSPISRLGSAIQMGGALAGAQIGGTAGGPGVAGTFEHLVHAAKEVVEHPGSKKGLHKLEEAVAAVEPKSQQAGG